MSADVFNEMESLRAEVLAQRQLIKDESKSKGRETVRLPRNLTGPTGALPDVGGPSQASNLWLAYNSYI